MFLDVIIGLFLIGTCIGIFLILTLLARKAGFLSAPEEGAPSKLGVTDYIKKLKGLQHSLIFRFIMITLLVLGMTIPLNMVEQIVAERSSLHSRVLADIAKTWGSQQLIMGPALIIPFTEKHQIVTTKEDKDGNDRTEVKTKLIRKHAIVLPETIDLKNTIQGEHRKRSLYKSLVYTADIKISGQFNKPNITSLSDHVSEIHWDRARIVIGLSDTKAINTTSALSWNEEALRFEPGTSINGLIARGFHAPLTIDTTKESFTYSFNINVNGSQSFHFTPLGRTTNVEVISNWPHPSFNGSALPAQRHIDTNGFKASWSVSHLARNYPQLWTIENQTHNLEEFTAGVSLFESVTLYTQIIRAIKYGVLFICLTFITFLIFELAIKKKLHFVQYAVIGLALTLFYLTLLSMAEHSNFFTAYISAAGVIIAMISSYAYAAIRKLSSSIIITIMLTALFSLLYSLLQLEDYALLAGTGLLLTMLAVLMYLTRNIGRS
ncbi:MAG: cell envelope integrity protein CreD [Thiotrichaceae bacterium]|nr:cell envelope integrity protein CreD [Thiotrichaceae bacterium]